MTKFLDRVFVWLGGALFVASLALTGWAYTSWFGQSRPWSGWQAVVLDALLLMGFGLHHSIFARASVKAALAAFVPDRLLRSVYVWTASLLLAAVCVAWQTVGGDVYVTTSTWARAAHAVVQLAGVWLIARSVAAIDALELAGIRVSQPAATRASLQVSGPYRLVRHPLYLGWVLVVFGTSHLTGDRLAFGAITTAYLVIAIPWEERSLTQTFGDEYRRYTQHVRWKLVPFVY
jgi:protein-S-isoprenylcysteine O-methyltransferase Ste14